MFFPSSSRTLVRYRLSRLGKSRVLYQAPQHKALEQWRATAIDAATRNCQRYVKGHQGRTRAREIRAIGGALAAAVEARQLDLMEVAVADANALQETLLKADIHYAVTGLPAGEVLLVRLREEHRVAALLRSFQGQNPLECYEAMKVREHITHPVLNMTFQY